MSELQGAMIEDRQKADMNAALRWFPGAVGRARRAT